MKKEISVYELLGLIKFKKIRTGTQIYAKNGLNTRWFVYDEKDIEFNDRELIKIVKLVGFNGKVTITEDKSIIEKLDTTSENTLFTMECYTGIPEQAQDWNFEVLKNKLNEVIDCINRKEDK